MALIKCQECGREISSAAKACPQCGAKNPKRAGFGEVLLVIIGAVFVLGVIGSAFNRGPPSPPSELAWYACQQFIQNSLRDPSSAEFVSDYSSALVAKTSAGYKALMRVRANNGFGGKTVSNFSCDVAYDGTNFRSTGIHDLGTQY